MDSGNKRLSYPNTLGLYIFVVLKNQILQLFESLIIVNCQLISKIKQ